MIYKLKLVKNLILVFCLMFFECCSQTAHSHESEPNTEKAGTALQPNKGTYLMGKTIGISDHAMLMEETK